MSVISTRPDGIASQTDGGWQWQLDALLSGECSEDEFIDGLSKSPDAGADSAWNVVALLDQRYRLGQVPIDLFRSIEARIARRELSAADSGYTIEFEPIPAVTRVTTQPLAAEASIDSAANLSGPPGVEIGCVLRNRYVLESRLGRGGIGTVFKALDRYRCDLPEADRHVAIKFLNKKTDGAQLLSNLRREFFCAQALSHPNIVKVYELELDGDAAFFTMELLDGELLSDLTARLGPAPIPRTMAWTTIREIGAALAHAHSRNVAHGDLKPQNIMITKSGEVRLLDFGASNNLPRHIAGTAATHGTRITALTPAYACCELLEGQHADPRDDLYALACLSYELLSGKHPFERRRSSEARDRGMLAQRPPGLTRRQWETLRNGLAWKRQDRSMAVPDWIARLTAVPMAASILRPLHSTPARRAATVALGVSIILGLGLWAAFRVPSSDRQIGGDAAVTAPGAQDIARAAATPDAQDVAPATAPAVAQDIAPAAARPVAQGIAPAAARPVAQAIAPAAARPVAQAIAPAAARPVAQGIAPVASPIAPAVSSVAPGAVSPNRQAAAAPPNTATARRPGSSADRISISADGYKMRSGQKFAEIHVRRSSGSEGDTSFAWWTEPSTAEPGVDYVAQDRITQRLPRGKRMASLFIRLTPNPARTQSAVFYVVIGEPGNGASLGRARTAVQLPAK
jgi:serine/threonine protein kinase